MEALRPWQTLDLPLDLGGTVRTRISLGMLLGLALGSCIHKNREEA